MHTPSSSQKHVVCKRQDSEKGSIKQSINTNIGMNINFLGNWRFKPIYIAYQQVATRSKYIDKSVNHMRELNACNYVILYQK